MSKKLAVETVILAQKVKELYEQCRYSEAIAPATELAVLSACETGLGDIQTGEGVFDLRRAFMLAGAKTLVMSLWSVPDEATKELMVDFYRRILAGEGRADALR
ncbi:MAG: CHAT domain-containing protein, partial [Halobacteriota archaeon]